MKQWRKCGGSGRTMDLRTRYVGYTHKYICMSVYRYIISVT